MTRILLADDHAVVRTGLRELLIQRESISVVGEAEDGDSLLSLVEHTPADLVLLDVSMPGPPFLDLLKRLRTLAPALRVLVLTAQPEDQIAVRALRAGASGYFTKDRPFEELLDAIRRIGGGGSYISVSLAQRLATSLEGGAERAPHDLLSDREMEVLVLLGSGKSVKQISADMKLSVKTVSTFRTRLMKKMGFTTNADAVQYVARQGLAPRNS
ncbi:MAG TPA: response regulator transcription factor [Gemmatimonadaceae bacterium]|nr:response regulator transcription factor [Gemmatimonadaceae bacterium]